MPSGRSIDNTTAFIIDFGVRRCGKPLAKIEEAWTILASTSFRAGGGVGLGHAYCSNVNPSRGSWQSGSHGSRFWRGGYPEAEVESYTDALMRAWGKTVMLPHFAAPFRLANPECITVAGWARVAPKRLLRQRLPRACYGLAGELLIAEREGRRGREGRGGSQQRSPRHRRAA